MCGLDFCLERFRGSEPRQAKQPDVVSRCEEGLTTACYIDDDDDDDDDNVNKDDDDDDADALRKTDHY